MNKNAMALSGMLVVGFGVLLAFAGPNAGSPNYVDPVQIVVPKCDIPLPTGYTVPTTNSAMIAPPRNILAAAAWATNGTYKNGSIVESGGAFYWDSAMTFTNCTPVDATGPSHLVGSKADAGGGITWTRLYASNRYGIDVVNQGAASAWLSVGSTATQNAGIYLPGGQPWKIDGPWMQHAVYAFTTSSVAITVTER